MNAASMFSRRALAGLATALLATGAAQAHELTVHVLNARSAQGNVAGALYADEAGWLQPGRIVQGQRAAAATDKVVLVYRNLPSGSYAISLFHDENDNGKLDRNVVGSPLERFGFSRDAMGRMAPPSFADASIDLQADTTITITLR